MKYLFLMFLLLLSANANIYRDGAKEVVIDDVARLMWIDNISVIKIKKDHDSSTKYCEKLNYAGFDNCRLAKVEEFELIVDKRNIKNYINRAFKYNVPDGYWALKSLWRTLWFYADYMHFVSGTPYYDSRHKNKYIRCVREY